MDFKKYIVNQIEKMSGRYTPYQIFSDWIAMSSMAISNGCQFIHNKTYHEREERYRNIASRYMADELKEFANMTGALSIVLEERFGDILGEIYMESGCGNKNTGQFFTPYHLSYLTAKISYGEKIKEIGEHTQIDVNEPSCGGGGMIIAIANVMKEYGLNYQRQLRVVAQDLDWNGVYMTYMQLSLLGIRAKVVQGDTLREPYTEGYSEGRILRTPAEMGVLL